MKDDVAAVERRGKRGDVVHVALHDFGWGVAEQPPRLAFGPYERADAVAFGGERADEIVAEETRRACHERLQ
jgi:hypothetical protein